MFRKYFHLLCSFLFVLVLVMTTFAIGPHVEARFWPVVNEVFVTIEDRNDDGVMVLLSYTKRRDCEWLGVAWYVGETRLAIDFRQETWFMPRSRLPGDHLVGPWTIQNVDTLVGTRAEIYHRCHPFWTIHNTLFPPKDTWRRREHVQLSEGAWAPFLRARHMEKTNPRPNLMQGGTR